MHDQEILVEGIRRRLNGESVKSIARDLGVSVGWASENLGRIAAKVQASRSLQRAEPASLKEDLKRWGEARRVEWCGLNEHKQAQRIATLEVLRAETKEFESLPETESKAYARLDQLQQLFKRNPGSGVFYLVQMNAPALHEHLVAWSRGYMYKAQDKSDERFARLATVARDHVITHLRPPSHASQSEEELAAARWLGRWIANARGRGERRKNLARAGIMLEIATIVDGLRSSHIVVREPAVEAVEDGTLAGLFEKLIQTKNSYEYER